jgi:hypothetical protein
MADSTAPGTARHLCPLGCGWHYDEPPPILAGTAGISPDPTATDAVEALRSIGEQAARQSAGITEAAVREHVAVHGIHTAEELRAAMATAPAVEEDQPMPTTPPADDEVRQLLVHPAVWPALTEWLRGRGIELGRLPMDEEDLPTYVMVPSDALMATVPGGAPPA